MAGGRGPSRKRYRYAIVRGNRSYVVCGARELPVIRRPPWISGSVFALVLLAAALSLGHPAPVPIDRATAFPLLPSASYSASDFFSAAR